METDHDMIIIGEPSCIVEASEGAETERGKVVLSFDAKFSLADSDAESTVFRREFLAKTDSLVYDEEGGQYLVAEMLAVLQVPPLNSLIDSILIGITDIAAEADWWLGINATVSISLLVQCLPTPYPGLGTGPIHLYFDHEQEHRPDHSYNAGAFVPASDHSIRVLERVTVSDSSVDCPVCLEDLPAGSLVTRLPCSHTFHGDCIVKWLSISKFCPLCGFEFD